MTTPAPAGYYAVVDPDDPGTITYWRMGTRGLQPWPPRARYGPALLRSDVPTALRAPARRRELAAYVTDWYRLHRDPWTQQILDQVDADPAGCAKRFAEFAIRCCSCGRTLTDAYSKTVGLGTECRRGIKPGTLAALLTPAVGQAHAAALGPDHQLPGPAG